MWLKVWSDCDGELCAWMCDWRHDRRSVPHQVEDSTVAQNAAVSMRPDTDAYFATLQRELSLDESQATAMHAILDKAREDYKSSAAPTCVHAMT